MAFFRQRKVEKNYDLLTSCSWYTPGTGGLFAVLGMFLVGALIGSLVSVGLSLFMPSALHTQLVGYPLMFVPVFIFVRFKSMSNSSFERGFRLDSNHFGPSGGWVAALVVTVATLGAIVILEGLNSLLPEMPSELKDAMEMMTGGPLWLSLALTAVLAPLCEEWLCRGVVLRGLLNYGRTGSADGVTSSRGMNPALAIVVQALFFAAIHMNLWQGLTAFLIGCLMGYVYYRTGSLKLTMLMHMVNNASSVLLVQFGGEKVRQADTLLDLIPAWEYWMFFALSLAAVAALVLFLRKIPLQDPQGNCDVIPSLDDLASGPLAESL